MAIKSDDETEPVVPVMVRMPQRIHARLVKAAKQEKRKVGPQGLKFIEDSLKAEGF